MRLLIPTILVLSSIGLFFVFINPTYGELKVLKENEAQYDEALTKSREIQTLRDELLGKRNSYSTADLDRLAKLLPDNVDNVRLILDLDGIASAYGIRIKNMQIQRDQTASSQQGAVGPSQRPYDSVVLTFSFASTYENLVRFLQDLESSLRIVDVTRLSFTEPSGDLAEYTISIRTYWLR
jgi:Tfp pilus assembly protein PilO